MYPSITPLIRDAIKRRYELIPYLYSLALESHLTATPPQRWVGWGYEADSEVWTSSLLNGETQYWLGDTLLIGGVYEPSVDTARIYLPSARKSSNSNDTIPEPEEGYINLNAPYQHLPAGQWTTIPSTWTTSIPLLAKIGGAILIGKPQPTLSPLDDPTEFPSLVADDYRAVEIFPPKGSSKGHMWTNIWYEDDGISAQPEIARFELSYACDEDVVRVVGFEKKGGDYQPAWKSLTVFLPVADERVVTVTLGGVAGRDREKTDVEHLGRDARGRRIFRFPVAWK
jgi:hypothetical protein